MPFSALSHLDCPRCGARHDADQVQGTCGCGSPLLARYDLELAARQASPRDIAGRRADLWRYHELLPVREAGHVVSLGEGMTPLLALPRLGQVLGLPNLMMKDDGIIPTGTFKARGAAVGVSRAAELGVSAIAMPTNGNAGAAWAVYAARAGMRSLIVMPGAAPAITRAECVAAGAELYLVDGLIGDAARLVADVVERRPGYQNAATLREPYRIEGKKTMGLEIAEQLGWRMPDVIVYPTGGGVGIIGIYKALRELLELGWVSGGLPRLVAVQSAGCAPIVAAFQAGAAESEPWPDAKTVAFGITVPKALGDFLILEALYATGGTAVAVTDEALLADQRAVARLEGSFICPEGAACFTAVRQLRESGWLSESDEVVVLNTGTGLIYPDTVPARAPVLPASASIPALSSRLQAGQRPADRSVREDCHHDDKPAIPTDEHKESAMATPDLAAEEVIAALDSFYCHNVVVALWADAVANRLEGSAIYLLSDEIPEVADSARAASRRLADRIGDIGGAVTADPRHFLDRAPGDAEFTIPDCSDPRAIVSYAVQRLNIIIDAYQGFLDKVRGRDDVSFALVVGLLGAEKHRRADAEAALAQ